MAEVGRHCLLPRILSDSEMVMTWAKEDEISPSMSSRPWSFLQSTKDDVTLNVRYCMGNMLWMRNPYMLVLDHD